MKAFLNTMSEVEEIKSQPDSEDYSDSDKESVVIGNLGNMVRQNSLNFNMNIPQLSKGFQDNQSFESTVMSARIDRNTLSKLRDYIMWYFITLNSKISYSNHLTAKFFDSLLAALSKKSTVHAITLHLKLKFLASFVQLYKFSVSKSLYSFVWSQYCQTLEKAITETPW